MANHSKPFPSGEGSEARKPYRSPIKGEGYGFGTTVPKGAVEHSSSTDPLLADARRGTDGAPRPIRILLDPEQSEILRELGDCFVVIGRASHPDNPQRMALHAVPCSVEAGGKAVKVAQGELETRRRKA